MTTAEEQQIAFIAETNSAVRALLQECFAAKVALAAAAKRDIERCTAILELAGIAEEFATIGVDVAKKRRVVAIRKTAEPSVLETKESSRG